MRDRVTVKIKALQAHRSQVPADWSWMSVAEELLPEIVGKETFLRVFSRVESPHRETDLFAGCGERPA